MKRVGRLILKIMKKNVLFCLIVVLAMLASPATFSQSSFSLNLGPAFPLSDFGDDDYFEDDDAGGASIGADLGLHYRYQFSDMGFGFTAGLDIMYNGLKGDIKDDIEDELDNYYEDYDISYMKYLNFPLMFGLDYRYEASDNFSVFGGVAIGPDFLKMTNEKLEYEDYYGENMEEVISYKMSPGFAVKFGGGVLINKKLIIGVDYWSLGSHEIEGEYEIDGDSEDFEYDDELKISMLTLTLGIEF